MVTHLLSIGCHHHPSLSQHQQPITTPSRHHYHHMCHIWMVSDKFQVKPIHPGFAQVWPGFQDTMCRHNMRLHFQFNLLYTECA